MKPKYLFILFSIICFTTLSKAQSPPFSGTIFLDPDIITPSDPTTFTTLAYAGQGNRTMFDRRVNDWINVNAYLFNASYNDGLSLEIQVNPEFGSISAATTEANKYAPILGQLPTVLRKDAQTVWIHKGVQPFGGGNNNFLIHTGQTALYEQDGILEETLIHEGSHTSLDNPHATTSGWLAAQNSDPTFISTYARDNPTSEDIAESFLCWVMVRYRADRISQALYDVITQTIPNRLAYFDAQNFDMYPIVSTQGLPSCNEQTITISSNISNQTINNADKIVTSGNVSVAGTVNFQAFIEVTMNSGFQVNAGNNFTATIIPCNVLQEAPVMVVSRKIVPSLTQVNLIEPPLEIDQPIGTKLESSLTNEIKLSLIPNPVSTEATIEIQLANTEAITLDLFDINGRRLKSIIPLSSFQKGTHQIFVSAEELRSGVYYISLQSNTEKITKKIVVH